MKMNQQSYKNFQLLQGGVAFKMDDSITQSMSSLVETGEIIGRIEFLNESLILLEGIEEVQLEQGLGHDPMSSLPGNMGNCLIYGHREQFLWSLKEVQLGDKLMVRTTKGVFYYTVEDISILEPDDSYIFESENKATLTLVTCYPFIYFGPTKERYVVKASLD